MKVVSLLKLMKDYFSWAYQTYCEQDFVDLPQLRQAVAL